MPVSFRKFLIGYKGTIKDAMRRMTDIGEKQLFVVDEKNRLFGALSDGDVRQWILKNKHLTACIKEVCNRHPCSVRENYDIDSVRKKMLSLRIEAIPVVASDGTVCTVLSWEEVFAGKVKKRRERLDVQIIIMAGGKGTRLDPFTRVLPKPLIPIGEKPILQIIMDKFVEHGVKEFYLSVNHKARMIKSYFEEFNGGYKIHYVEENKPLGTIGSLRLIKNKIKGPFFVTNCDTIINTDLNDIIKSHSENKYDMTVVVSCKRYIIPYGICIVESGGVLNSIQEKPEHDILVSTGMYVMNPKIIDLIPEHKPMGANELIEKAKKNGLNIGVFPISEKSWIDVGQWEEYQKAVKHFQLSSD